MKRSVLLIMLAIAICLVLNSLNRDSGLSTKVSGTLRLSSTESERQLFENGYILTKPWPMASKYHNELIKVDGITFHSKREARYYAGLKYAKMAGDLRFFLRQVPFDLPGDPPIRYLCDFLEFWKNGEIRFVDVKGFRTPTYQMKKRMVEALYPVKILET